MGLNCHFWCIIYENYNQSQFQDFCEVSGNSPYLIFHGRSFERWLFSWWIWKIILRVKLGILWKIQNLPQLKFVCFFLQKMAIKGVPVDFDLSLRYQISWTDHASFNLIFLLKHMTQKVYGDSLSAVTKPPGGSRELIKYETSKAINFGYSYSIFMIFLPFDFKFMCLSDLVLSLTYFEPFSQN